jgi:ubiquinone/menaquinone biosynthesis C-methylase UbiE
MKDNFSRQADIYARYRPQYPKELFDFILTHTTNKRTAWDCATGNGQSARVLAKYFDEVLATDISQKQIDQAERADNIHYSVQPADQTGFADDSFDLIVVSQALHWFATDKFYAEATRVARPSSLFAAWSYSLLFISPDIDRIIRSFYREIVGPYWDAERRYVDDEYQTILFPYEEIKAPVFNMNYYWTLPELEGYINTWSATQKYIVANNHNPVQALVEEIRPWWKNEAMNVRFPLHTRIGRVKK